MGIEVSHVSVSNAEVMDGLTPAVEQRGFRRHDCRGCGQGASGRLVATISQELTHCVSTHGHLQLTGQNKGWRVFTQRTHLNCSEKPTKWHGYQNRVGDYTWWWAIHGSIIIPCSNG